MASVRNLLQAALGATSFGFLVTVIRAFYRVMQMVLAQAEQDPSKLYTYVLPWTVIGLIVTLALLLASGALKQISPSSVSK